MLKKKLEKYLPEWKEHLSEALGELTLKIDKADLRKVVKILKEQKELCFEQLMDLSAVDFMNHEKPHRFEVVYHFLSLTFNHRLRIKCFLDEDDLVIDSLCDFWKCANWYERECYDMYGIRFQGHPDLRRILMYDGFEGYPLRKDYLITQEQPRIQLKEVEERTDYMTKKEL
jgi:NADH-quinone oxidoreductase subunit C